MTGMTAWITNHVTTGGDGSIDVLRPGFRRSGHGDGLPEPRHMRGLPRRDTCQRVFEQAEG
jgi:hypothetical protein